MKQLLCLALMLPVAAMSQQLRQRQGFTLNPRKIPSPIPMPVPVVGAPPMVATVATLYVASPQGVSAYNAGQDGTLTAVAGGPFPVTGNLVGATVTDLVTFDADNLYDYTVNADGTVSQGSISASTQRFGGAQCGTNAGANLVNGVVYVQLAGATDGNGDTICDALQAYTVGQGFAFLGATTYDMGRFAVAGSQPVVSGAGKWGFALTQIGEACEQEFNLFAKEPVGALDWLRIPGETDPTPDPTGGEFYPVMVAADSTTNHLAVAMVQDFAPPCGPMGDVQIASYTVNSDGTLTSTNTWQNMPDVGAGVGAMSIDPSGTRLAAAIDGGLEIYNFSGGAPITPLSQNLLPGAGIGAAVWDNSAHLYAWGVDSDNQFKVFVFNTTGQVALAGSPLVVPGSTGMVVAGR